MIAALPMLCAAGCSPHRENLPTYPWTNEPTALRTLQARAKAIRTITAQALLTLTRRDGQSVRLDGALAMSLPDKLVRLRAFKFNHAVFDLSLQHDELWIETPRDAHRSPGVVPATLSAAQLARAMSLFGGDIFTGPEVQVIDSGGPRFSIRTPLDQGQTMIAHIDRGTLTVRQYRLADPTGVTRFTLTPMDYRVIGTAIWPTRLIAQSDSGRIEVELRDVEINGNVSPQAFIPPPGAQRVP